MILIDLEFSRWTPKSWIRVLNDFNPDFQFVQGRNLNSWPFVFVGQKDIGFWISAKWVSLRTLFQVHGDFSHSGCGNRLIWAWLTLELPSRLKNVLYKNGQTCHHYMFLPIHESSYTLEISPNPHQGPLRRVLELTFLSLYPATKMRRQDPAQCCSRRDETSTLRLKIDIRSWLLCSTLNQVFPSMALQNAFGSFLYIMTTRKTIFLGFATIIPTLIHSVPYGNR